MKVLREGGLGSLVLAGIAVTAAAAIWSAVRANNTINEMERAAEAADFDNKKVIRLHDATKKELKDFVDARLAESLLAVAPDAVIETVIKWRTKKVPVYETKWRDVVCPSLPDPTPTVSGDREPVKPPPLFNPNDLEGFVDGQIVGATTEKGNVIISGFADAFLDYDGREYHMFGSEFDWDATEALTLAGLLKKDPVKRWLLGVEYALLTNETTLTPSCGSRDRSPRNYRSLHGYDDYSCQSSPVTFSLEKFRVDFSRIWFPRKKVSIATGGFAQSNAIGPRLSVLF